MSDTGIMRILGETDPLPPPPDAPTPTTRPCPRCAQTVSIVAHVCEHCRCYIGPLPGFMENMQEPPTAPRP